MSEESESDRWWREYRARVEERQREEEERMRREQKQRPAEE